MLKLQDIVGDDTKVVPLRPLQKAPSQQRVQWRSRKRSFVQREARWWARRLARDFAIAAALVLGFVVYAFLHRMPLSLWPASSSSAGSFGEQSFTVTDGDTVRLHDGTAVRLVGFNTPETFEPECERERQLGERASARLEELVARSNLQLDKIACSCQPGTEGTERCNHGRSCGTLLADGHDVGDILISEGLAVPFICGATSCPPTPRPWCS
ncbi:thermonuclease family protein [Sinorhizobium meliloti]|uniref:thermonuclease family protein n=1 Tax=Rhizobium meliloti TaxID=382 RepID=UPI0030A36707